MASWVSVLLALAAIVALSTPVRTRAEDATTEEARLAAILRQLDSLDRIAQQGEGGEQAAGQRNRYHFDYRRLREDIARIRAGIQGYLSPVRAQPRDPQPLNGQYRIDAEDQP